MAVAVRGAASTVKGARHVDLHCIIVNGQHFAILNLGRPDDDANIRLLRGPSKALGWEMKGVMKPAGTYAL